MKIYCQGQIVAEEDAKISASDHGFLYGASLFETLRTYNKKPSFLEEHVERLSQGCEAFGISPGPNLLISEPGLVSLRELIAQLLAENNLPDAVFRYTLSAGEMPPGLPSGLYSSPSEVIFVRPLPPARDTTRLRLLETRRTEPEVFPRPKSAHYMNNVIAWRELQKLGAEPGDEGLMFTQDGRLSEGIASNVFLVLGNRVVTPAPGAHLLAGITRHKTIELAREAKIEAIETDLGLCDLTEAEAIFITNSVRGITPVKQVVGCGGKMIWQGDSSANRIVRGLIDAYSRL